jgi:putative lipase involved disintegration of autophagic bodies
MNLHEFIHIQIELLSFMLIVVCDCVRCALCCVRLCVRGSVRGSVRLFSGAAVCGSPAVSRFLNTLKI